MEINALAAAPGAPAGRTDRGLNTLRTEDFFKILVSELQQQDPFEPAKTADMISQVSQIRSIELSGRLTDTLDTLADQQRAGGASNLLGKFVSASVPAGDGSFVLVEGVVTGVRFNADGTSILELDSGLAVRAEDVQRITSLDALSGLLAEDDSEGDDGESPSAQADKADERALSKPLFSLDSSLRI